MKAMPPAVYLRVSIIQGIQGRLRIVSHHHCLKVVGFGHSSDTHSASRYSGQFPVANAIRRALRGQVISLEIIDEIIGLCKKYISHCSHYVMFLRICHLTGAFLSNILHEVRFEPPLCEGKTTASSGGTSTSPRKYTWRLKVTICALEHVHHDHLVGYSVAEEMDLLQEETRTWCSSGLTETFPTRKTMFVTSCPTLKEFKK